MKLSHAHHAAEGVRTAKQAARLYNNIEYELALGEHPAEHQAEGERALRHLEEHFPGVKDQAREVTEPPATSRTASRNLRPPAPKPSPAPRPRRRRPPAQRARQVVSAAYDAASDTTAGELVGQFVLGGLVLSIFYLFLTRAAAAGKLFQGATSVVRAVVSPVVDPLNPRGALS